MILPSRATATNVFSWWISIFVLFHAQEICVVLSTRIPFLMPTRRDLQGIKPDAPGKPGPAIARHGCVSLAALPVSGRVPAGLSSSAEVMARWPAASTSRIEAHRYVPELNKPNTYHHKKLSGVNTKALIRKSAKHSRVTAPVGKSAVCMAKISGGA